MNNTTKRMSDEQIEEVSEGLYRLRLSMVPTCLNARRVGDGMEAITQLRSDLAAEREHAQRAVDQAETFKDERDTLAAQVKVLREGLEKIDNVLLGIADELSRKPVDCLGSANDGINQWPIRDEMIDDAKRGRASITDTLTAATEAMHCAVLKIQDGSPHHAEGVLSDAIARLEDKEGSNHD